MSCVINKLRFLRLGRRGTASLEFALVAIPFFMLMLGIIDLSNYFATQQSLETAVSEAQRAAVTSSSANISNDCSTIKGTVASVVPYLGPNLSLCVTKTTSSGVVTVTVTGTYPFTFILAVWSGNNGTLSHTVTTSY
jgi:Flp pilus assembly protein TadG